MGVFRKTRIHAGGPLEIRKGKIFVSGVPLEEIVLKRFGRNDLVIRDACVEILSCESVLNAGEQRELGERLKTAGYGEKVRKGDRVMCVEVTMESWGSSPPYDANNVSEEPASWCGSAQLPATVVRKVEGGYLVKYDYLCKECPIRFVPSSRIKRIRSKDGLAEVRAL